MYKFQYISIAKLEKIFCKFGVEIIVLLNVLVQKLFVITVSSCSIFIKENQIAVLFVFLSRNAFLKSHVMCSL